MGTFLTDSFTGTDGTLLTARSGETGASWSLMNSHASGFDIQSNRARGTATTAANYASGVPDSADYYVEAVMRWGGSAFSTTGIAARVASGANTMYSLRDNAGVGVTQLVKVVAGSTTVLASASRSISSGSSYTYRLTCTGNTLASSIDGAAPFADVSDSSITAAGFAGVRNLSAIPGTTGTGWHIESITAATAGGGGTTGPLTGSVELAFTPSGTLSGVGALTGSSALAFALSATIAAIGALSGSASVTFSSSATLGGAGALDGTASLAFDSQGSLAGLGSLAGGSSFAFSPAGSLEAAGSDALTGSSSFAFAPSGALTGRGALAGSLGLTFTTAGTLSVEGARPLAPTFTATASQSAFAVGSTTTRFAAASGGGTYRVRPY